MIPVVVRSCEEMLKLVPNELREASYALGVPKWRTILKVVLPTALAGIVTGITLAVARVIGETAPLLIIAGIDRLGELQPVRRPDGDPAGVHLLPVRSPGIPPEFSIDRAWGAALVAADHRHAAQPGRPPRLLLLLAQGAMRSSFQKGLCHGQEHRCL